MAIEFGGLGRIAVVWYGRSIPQPGQNGNGWAIIDWYYGGGLVDGVFCEFIDLGMNSLELSDDNIKTLTKTMGGESKIAKNSKNLAQNPWMQGMKHKAYDARYELLAWNMQRGRAFLYMVASRWLVV